MKILQDDWSIRLGENTSEARKHLADMLLLSTLQADT